MSCVEFPDPAGMNRDFNNTQDSLYKAAILPSPSIHNEEGADKALVGLQYKSPKAR